MRTLNRPDWDNQPIRLSDEEKKDLYSVLEDFFSCFHLQDARETMYDWLVAALSSDCGTYNTGFARSNLIFVYEKLELLIEAAHGLLRKRRKSVKRKQRHRERR
jgi:hypothetical protein